MTSIPPAAESKTFGRDMLQEPFVGKSFFAISPFSLDLYKTFNTLNTLKKLFSTLMLLQLKPFVDGHDYFKTSANFIHLYSETSVCPMNVLFLRIKR